jgi:hypothetical protein
MTRRAPDPPAGVGTYGLGYDLMTAPYDGAAERHARKALRPKGSFPEERQDLANLAGLVLAQLVVQDLRDSDPDWKEAIVGPAGAAEAPVLRALLRALRAHGVEPDPDPAAFDVFARMLANGYAVLWSGRGPIRVMGEY